MAPPSLANNQESSTSSESDSEMVLDYKNINTISNNSNDNDIQKAFSPLVVAFVGLPARGKTVLAHKISRYLNWIGTKTEVFSVCDYCRRHIESYNHNVFRADNRRAVEMRERSTMEAMKDATQWLKSEGQVAILDGTNPNKAYRQLLFEYFVKQLKYKILFVECNCDVDTILERNIKEILKFNVDYKKMKKEVAMNDLRCKIEHFKDQYEAINRRAEPYYSFIKTMNDGEDIYMHKVEGPLQGKILYYISNAKHSPKTLYFTRHGESEYNLVGRIGGDTSLSPRGFQYAQRLADYFNHSKPSGLRIWTSEKRRTKQTAEGISAPVESLHQLNELDAGVCEGLSYEEMQERHPQEFAWRDQDKLTYRYPWGESYIDIMTRLEPVLLQLESEDNILVVSHQAVLRCILGYLLKKEPQELPYMNVPLHTIIKLTSDGYNFNIEHISLNVDCVDTCRKKPKNCAGTRSTHDALITVPYHYDHLSFWPAKNLVEPN